MTTIKIHNVETGEVIEREMNAEELEQWESARTVQAEREAAEAQKAADKAALLTKLGIPDDEAKLLLS
jgi:hypothetical protein